MNVSLLNILKTCNAEVTTANIIGMVAYHIEKDCAGYPGIFIKAFEQQFNELFNEEYGPEWIRIQIVKPGDDEK